jgi:hypothetical protein
MRRSFDELLRVHGREVRRQKADRSQVQPAIRHRGKNRRELAGRTGGPDPLVSGVLRQAELLDAVCVHGWVTGAHVKLAGIHLTDVRKERRSPDPVPAD